MADGRPSDPDRHERQASPKPKKRALRTPSLVSISNGSYAPLEAHKSLSAHRLLAPATMSGQADLGDNAKASLLSIEPSLRAGAVPSNLASVGQQTSAVVPLSAHSQEKIQHSGGGARNQGRGYQYEYSAEKS